MQPIHINQPYKRAAASECRQVLSRSSLKWLIWSVGDEGCMMAPASSHEASVIRRYWPETIAGEFGRGVTRSRLVERIGEARCRQAVRADNRTDARRAYEAQYKARQRAKAAA